MTALVHSIESLNVTTLESSPPGLRISIEGETNTPGWTDFALSHYVYVVPPADGIYEADMTGQPPSGTVIQRVTPFCHSETWSPFPADLKGLKLNSGTNSITVAVL